MRLAALDSAVRAAGGRILAALTARYRDLDLAEEAFAEACLRATRTWPERGQPRDCAAWLYAVAARIAIDALRTRKSRQKIETEVGEPEIAAEDIMSDDDPLIPDERLRLIFVCCHPALSREARLALTLRLVCGLPTEEIAQAFLVPLATMAQRLVRAKHKVAEAQISFEIPGPAAWPARLDSVLSTLEVAYASAHADAAGAGRTAGFAVEILELTRVLADLLPAEEEVLALAALVRYAEARRPARLDDDGAMKPLSDQDPAQWKRALIEEGDAYLRRAAELGPSGPRTLQAAIHSAWCARRTVLDPLPWRTVLKLYDALLQLRDDPVIRVNRAVAVAQVESPEAALCEIEALDAAQLATFPPYHAVRADLLARSGRAEEARAAYDALLALPTGPAERLWLKRKRDGLARLAK